MAAWLSSTGISHHNLLCIHLIHLSAVNSSPSFGIAPQSLNSSFHLLHLLGDLSPCPSYVWLQQGLFDSHSIWLPQICYFTLSLKCFSSDSDNCPNVGVGPVLQFPPPAERRSSPSNTPVFPLVPSSYRVLDGSMHSLLLVRYSCPLSVGIAHALLCLKVYS